MTATRISHSPRARRLFVQRLARWKCLGAELDHLHQMDTPVASAPITTELMHRNESSRSAIPAIADPPSITLPPIEGPLGGPRKRYHFGACQRRLQRCFPAVLASGR